MKPNMPVHSHLWIIFLLFFSSALHALTIPTPELEERQAPLPAIPGPPEDPPRPAGDGAGPYQSEKPTIWDRLHYMEYRAMAVAAHGLGLDDAARHLDHYLDNVGTVLTVAPDNIMADIPTFKEAVRAQVEEFAKKAFQESKVALAKRTFVSPWTDFNATGELSPNWFLALGGFSYSVAGSVWVHKMPGTWVTELEWHVYVFDRYDWDKGKSVTIWGLTFTDEELGKMHLAGLAKEYVVRGKSTTFTLPAYEGGELPAPF